MRTGLMVVAPLLLLLLLPASPIGDASIPRAIPTAQTSATPSSIQAASIQVSPDDVQYGEILTVGIHGPSNASLRVWIIYEGIRNAARYNLSLNANGTSSSVLYIVCDIQSVLDDTCAWSPGSYTALLVDREDNKLNSTRFTVRLNDRMLWFLQVGFMRQQQQDNEATRDAQWAFVLVFAAAVSVAFAVFCFLLWVEVSGPIGLPDRMWRFVRRFPRLAGSVFFSRDDPYMSNLKSYPGENRPEHYRQNAQSYLKRRDRDIRIMERLEKRKERLMVRATHWEGGAEYWKDKETAETGRSLL